MTEEKLEKEAKQSYLDNTDHMQWDAEGEFDYTRGYINAAEPREKQIKELKQELEQAKKVQVVEHFEAYGQCRDSRRIAALEKENTELKSELTKAKEILEELAKMEYVINPPVDKVRSLMVKAEQFLKDVPETLKQGTR